MSLWGPLFGPRRAAARSIRRADRARDAGAHAEAAKFYSRALELTPARTDIRVQLGHMLKQTGHEQEAIAAYRDAKQLLLNSETAAAEFTALGVEDRASTPPSPP